MPAEQQRELARKGGLSPHPKRPIRKFCNRGHQLVGDNIRVATRTTWNRNHTKSYTYSTYVCRQCDKDSARERHRKQREINNQAKYEALQQPQPIRFCKRGHALTGSNIKVYISKRTLPNGTVNTRKDTICVQCSRDRYKRERYGNTDEPDKRAETNARLWTGVPNEKRVKKWAKVLKHFWFLDILNYSIRMVV